MNQIYHGTIKTKKQALAIAKDLRENNGTEKAVGAAKMLENNWHYIASRPMMQPEIIAMANTTPLHRKGGIMDIIINGHK